MNSTKGSWVPAGSPGAEPSWLKTNSVPVASNKRSVGLSGSDWNVSNIPPKKVSSSRESTSIASSSPAASGRSPSATGALVILYSDDLEGAEARVKNAGGEITERHEFPGGERFHFRDPAGNVLGVWRQVEMEDES